MSGFRLPDETQRLAIIGRTGSGKTVHGAWQLSRAPFHKQPYIIFDYKGDELLNQIPHLRHIDYKELPKHPGVYMIKPGVHERDDVEAYLWKVWQRERIGIYFDEMYQVPDPFKGGALRALFTQGRSKKIPVIGCTQRPRQISRFLFSEADFFATFHLSTKPDRQTVAEYDENGYGVELPKFCCRWYDVSDDFGCVLKPVPGGDVILDTFETRLAPKRRYL